MRLGGCLLAAWTLAAGMSLGREARAEAPLVQQRTNAARLWSSADAAVDVPLGAYRSARVAIGAEGGFVVAGTDGTTGDLFFLHHADGSTMEMPLPTEHADGLRAWPVLLEAGGRLEGALWLEGSGEQDFAIRAAAWNGTSWERVETVTPARGLPQLAVSAAVLDDGSWLAVWAGYDGDDDEIYWSRRKDGDWTSPRQLHRGNRVPDILPSVTAHGAGALAAWSVFDGNDYRVRTATFDGTKWRSSPPLDGLGAIDAGWQRVDGRLFVTYHSVEPEAWTVIELDREGFVVLQKSVAGEVTDRPLVSARDGSAPRLVFPTREGRSR